MRGRCEVAPNHISDPHMSAVPCIPGIVAMALHVVPLLAALAFHDAIPLRKSSASLCLTSGDGALGST